MNLFLSSSMFPRTLILILSSDNRIICLAVCNKPRFLVVIVCIYTSPLHVPLQRIRKFHVAVDYSKTYIHIHTWYTVVQFVEALH
jgi:hypothetical protein